MNRSLPAFRPMQSVLFEKPTVESPAQGGGMKAPISLSSRIHFTLMFELLHSI